MNRPPKHFDSADDAGITLADLQFLRGPGQSLLQQAQTLAAAGQTDSLRDIQKLREQFGQSAVHAALALAKTSGKALGPKGKFDGMADFFWAVPEALEQATSIAVARHKATRFAALDGLRAIADLCGGVGGDSFGLAQVAPVLSVEKSFIRTWMAARNAEAMSTAHPIYCVQGDVSELPILPATGVTFHIDPARRAGGKRMHTYADMIPGPAVVDALIHRFPAGAVKLGPGVDFDSLPEGHLEVISENGVCVQAVLWLGTLADRLGPGRRTATVIDRGTISSVSGLPTPVAVLSPVHRFMYEVDGAVHRAGLAPALVKEMGWSPVNVDGGLATSEAFIPDRRAAAFEAVSTFRYAEKLVPACLPEPCHVEVKPRGVALDTDRLQKLWSKAGKPVLSLLIYRTASGVMATLCRPMRGD
jgi:hypothetical protein